MHTIPTLSIDSALLVCVQREAGCIRYLLHERRPGMGTSAIRFWMSFCIPSTCASPVRRQERACTFAQLIGRRAERRWTEEGGCTR